MAEKKTTEREVHKVNLRTGSSKTNLVKKKAKAKPKKVEKKVQPKPKAVKKSVVKETPKKAEVKPKAKEKPKAEVKKQVKEKPKPAKKEKSYRISRSKEISKTAREKSRLEKKKGKFKRQNYGKKKRVPNRWRRPKGIDSGHRIDEKHKPAHPRSGYITPKKVRGLDVTGFRPVRVFNLSELEAIDPKTEAALIASPVGRKKRLEMQKRAQEKKIQVLNYKE